MTLGNANTMTSLERVRRAALLKAPDRVPVAPYMGNHGARVAGVPIDQYCQSGKLMAAAQIKAWETYQQDVLVAQSDNYYLAEGFGVVVQHHSDSTPTLKTPVVTDLAQVADLVIPSPYRDGRMPVYLEAIQRLAEFSRGEIAVRAPGTGPVSLAAHLMGPENFLIELITADRDPEGGTAQALRLLLEKTTQALIAFAKACVEAGAHIVQAGDSFASLDMISPRMYQRWAFPFEQRFFTELNQLTPSHGTLTLLHICGNMTPVLEIMADTGAQILEIDSKVDLKRAKAKVGQRVCLMGNLNPTEVLWRGSVTEVEQASRQAIADAGSGGGFILGSGCEVPVAAPQANLAAMVRVARNSRVTL